MELDSGRLLNVLAFARVVLLILQMPLIYIYIYRVTMFLRTFSILLFRMNAHRGEQFRILFTFVAIRRKDFVLFLSRESTRETKWTSAPRYNIVRPRFFLSDAYTECYFVNEIRVEVTLFLSTDRTYYFLYASRARSITGNIAQESEAAFDFPPPPFFSFGYREKIDL